MKVKIVVRLATHCLWLAYSPDICPDIMRSYELCREISKMIADTETKRIFNWGKRMGVLK